MDVWKKHMSSSRDVTSSSNVSSVKIAECCNSLIIYITKIISAVSGDDECLEQYSSKTSQDGFQMTDFTEIGNVIPDEEDSAGEDSVSRYICD